MQLIYQPTPPACYILLCAITETMPESSDLARIKAKEAGFIWDKLVKGRWATDSARVALKFAAFADDETRKLIIKTAPHERDPSVALMVYEKDCFVFYTPKVGYAAWTPLLKPDGYALMKFTMLPEPHWWTQDADIAAQVYETARLRPGFHAAEGVYERLKEHLGERKRALESSRAVDAAIEIPAPAGLEYLPFQRAGIAYAMNRPATLFGDEMGLGKSIESLGVVNADETALSVLVVCPASLKLNWQREARKWLVPKDYDRHMRPPVTGVGTSNFIPSCDFVIVNYEILGKPAVEGGKALRRELREKVWDVLIVDECHRLKNSQTLRARFTFAIKARRRLLLSGTPLPNRPRELWPILHYLAPKVWSDKWKFLNRYCFGGSNGFGSNFDGAQNLEELQTKMRAHVMCRRLKSEVLKELPPKRRQVIEIPSSGYEHLIATERERYEQLMRDDAAQRARRAELRYQVAIAATSENPEDYERAASALKTVSRKFKFEEISRIRRETAIAKVPAVLDHLDSVLEEQPKVVVFAHHKEVITAIAEHFGASGVTVYGETPMEERQRAVDRFQQDKSARVFIGGILAAGVGLTLTASSMVVFAELDWVPSNITQAEDRCHRIGATGESVLVQHLVLEGSLDSKMVHTLIAKQEVADRALDREAVAVEPDLEPIEAEEFAEIELPEQAAYSDTTKGAHAGDQQQSNAHGWLPENRAATHGVTREWLLKKADALRPEDIFLIHHGLQRLATVCDGAATEGTVGFNATDARVGRELARRPSLTPLAAALGWRICRKYNHSQLNGLLDRLYA